MDKKKITLAQFKRWAANSPNLTLDCVYRFGLTADELPPAFKGPRRVLAVRSYGLDLEWSDKTGRFESYTHSALTIPGAKMFKLDLDQGTLTVYNSAPRPATAREQAILDDWRAFANRPEFQKQAEYDALTDGSTTFFQEKWWFHDHKAEYLFRNRLYQTDPGTGRELIRDSKHPGSVALVYKVAGLETS